MFRGKVSWSWLTTTAALLALGLTVAAVSSISYYGSLRMALGALKREVIVPEQQVVDVGLVQPKSTKEFSFELMNCSGTTVQVVGAQASCTCLVLGKLPIDIPARGRATFVLSLRTKDAPPADPGNFVEKVVLYTNAATQPSLTLAVIGVNRAGPEKMAR